MTEIIIKNWKRSRSFGWGYSFTPTGEDAYSIKYPSAPDHAGTIAQITDAIDDDATFQARGGAFYNSAWFYKGQRITYTWAYTILKRADDLPYDPQTSYRAWSDRDAQHHFENDTYGYGWVPGWAGGNGADVTVRVYDAEAEQTITIMEAVEVFGIKYQTLRSACKAGRINARQSGATWLTTRQAIEAAIEAGKLRAPAEVGNEN